MVHDIATNELCPQERVEVGPAGAGQSSLLDEEESSQVQGHLDNTARDCLESSGNEASNI